MTTCARPTCHRKAHAPRHLCEDHLYAEGIYQKQVPAAPIIAHVQRCLDQGANLFAIAAATGCPHLTVYYLMRDRHTNVTARTAKKLMRATPDMARTVPAWPAARRIRALLASGHTYATIGAAGGCSHQFIHKLSIDTYSTINVTSMESIRAGYEHLEAQPVGGVDPRILAHGWPPVSAWIDIDDPDEDHPVPPGYVQIAGPVLAAMMRVVNAHGSTEKARKAVKMSKHTVTNWLSGHCTACSKDAATRVLSTARRLDREQVAA